MKTSCETSTYRNCTLCMYGLITIFFIQVILGNIVAKQRKKNAAKTDERLRLIQEILTTMKIIKMYTWERFYTQKTNEERM